MFFNQSRSFTRRFPGPFHTVRGSEGVDDTFDVICLQTDRPVISTYFWEDRHQAELLASVVADALNKPLLAAEQGESVPHYCLRREEFRRLYPGPFFSRRSHCDYYGPISEVICHTSGECVIFSVQWSSKRAAQMVSKQIVIALNALNAG